MKRLLKRFEDIMAAVAFAEEGEFETAREILREEILLSKKINKKGETIMAKKYGSRTKKPIGKMILMGIISIALYTVLLLNQDVINNYFGRGGIYALLPIATALIFSFIHGNFTGNFWTVLGVEAKKKREVK